MLKSDSIAQLAPSLVKAQAAMKHPIKNAKNPHLKNTFADLTEVINTTKPILAKHGLAVVQLTNAGCTDGHTEATVETMLIHESGEWISGMSTIPVEAQRGTNLAQAFGSAFTYLRRYGLSAITGVASEPDDDAHGANPARGNQQPRKPVTPATAQQIKKILALAETTEGPDAEAYIEKICIDRFKVDKLANISSDQASLWITKLEEKAGA